MLVRILTTTFGTGVANNKLRGRRDWKQSERFWTEACAQTGSGMEADVRKTTQTKMGLYLLTEISYRRLSM